MAETIDWPAPRTPRRRGRLLLLAVLAILLVGGGATLSYYVDALWFDSLGFSDVFWTTLNLRAAVFLGFAVVTFLILYGSFLALKGARLVGGRRDTSTAAWRGLSIAFASVLAMLAVRVYLGRFDRLLEDHTIFAGVTYTDAHITLTGLLVVSGALALGALIALVNAVSAPRARWLILAAAPAAACYAIVAILGWYVTSFIVKPNELVRETPFIAHNIEMTRQAYGLSRIEQRPFPAETGLEALDAPHNQATLQNIRLWDWRALQDTLRQIQET